MNEVILEIRIAKLQIMWSIAVATMGLMFIIPYGINPLVLLIGFGLFFIIWYWGAWSIREHVEEEVSKE